MVTLWMFHSLVFCDSVQGSSMNFSRVVLPYGLTHLPRTDLNWKILFHQQSCSCIRLRPHPAHSTAQSCCIEVRNYTPSFDCCAVLSAHHHITLLHKHSHADLRKNTIVCEISFEYL